MSFSEAILSNKFDALEETQDSIVSTSQWVLFHYRYADRIAAEWERYLNKAPVPKKLPLIYLCNEVVQQSRAKRKTEFIGAFQKILPRTLSKAHKEVPDSLKKKIIKIINIWKERRIFPKPVDLEGVSSSNGERSASAESNATFEDKLKSLGSNAQKFQRLYHELLLGSNGTFKGTDIKHLNELKKAISENIIQLQDLTETIEDEVGHIHEREKATEQKRMEVEQKQKDIEEQRRKEEEERIKHEQQRLEEENMLPTYEDNSDSDSDSEAPPKMDSDSDEELAEPSKEDDRKEESEKPEGPPVKKLRFAE